ncbi:methyltransferase [Candidatus Marinamargulisbacteria bacterium SCGC AG-343-D04]|nr:methyltransferase [Candidatus Marinamargulisbacteria bacterium SCGC AG-343-D04]
MWNKKSLSIILKTLMTKNKCNTGDNIMITEGEKWTFDKNVPQKFEDHISKSVPFYKEGHDLILKLSHYFTKKESIIYELGSSTGILSYHLAQHHEKKNCQVIGYDISEKMIDHAKQSYSHPSLHFDQQDISSIPLKKSDLIISYYTLQFIETKKRLPLVKSIYKALNPGAAFIFFEKTLNPNKKFQNLLTDLYINFKQDNGYSIEEINNKAKSLIGVLEPHSETENLELLKESSFTHITPIFQYLNFQGYLAIK